MAHERRTEVCSLVDVAPTLLSLCDIPYDKAEYDGVNLMDEHHDVVYSQYSSGPSATYMVASNHDKLVYSAIGDRYFYFDSSRKRMIAMILPTPAARSSRRCWMRTWPPTAARRWIPA